MNKKYFACFTLLALGLTAAAASAETEYRYERRVERDSSGERARINSYEEQRERRAQFRRDTREESGQSSSVGEIGTVYDGRNTGNTAAGDWDPTGDHSQATRDRR